MSLPLTLRAPRGSSGRLEQKLTLQGAGAQSKLVFNLEDIPARRLVDANWSGTVDLAGMAKSIQPGGPQPGGQVMLEARARGALTEISQLDFSAALQAKGVGVQVKDKTLLDSSRPRSASGPNS